MSSQYISNIPHRMVLISFKDNPNNFFTIDGSNVKLMPYNKNNSSQIWSIPSFTNLDGYSIGYNYSNNNVDISSRKFKWKLIENKVVTGDEERYLWYIDNSIYLTQDHFLGKDVIFSIPSQYTFENSPKTMLYSNISSIINYNSRKCTIS